MRRLVEDLIVPEAHWPIEQLRRRHYKRRMPEQIVQPRGDAPRAERVEEYLIGICRFVGIELVEQFVTGMRRIDQLRKFASQRNKLVVIQNAYPGQVSVLLV